MRKKQLPEWTGDIIKNALEKYDITVKQMASDLSVQQAALHKWMNNEVEPTRVIQSSLVNYIDKLERKRIKDLSSPTKSRNKTKIADKPKKAMSYMNGKHIKKLREQSGLSQKELAVLVDKSVASVGHWETGRMKVSEKDAELILNALKANAKSQKKSKRSFFISGKELKQFRTENKISRNAFAQLIGCSSSSIQSYESGRNQIPAKLNSIIKQKMKEYQTVKPDAKREYKKKMNEEKKSLQPSVPSSKFQPIKVTSVMISQDDILTLFDESKGESASFKLNDFLKKKLMHLLNS